MLFSLFFTVNKHFMAYQFMAYWQKNQKKN
jgi:hypothetical protein